MAPLGRGKLLHNHEPSLNGGWQHRKPTDRGAAEEPPRSPAQISGRKEVWMVPDGHAALEGLSLIPYLTSVAAGFYRNDVIICSGTSAGRARAMMHKFAVAPARIIAACKNDWRRLGGRDCGSAAAPDIVAAVFCLSGCRGLIFGGSDLGCFAIVSFQILHPLLTSNIVAGESTATLRRYDTFAISHPPPTPTIDFQYFSTMSDDTTTETLRRQLEAANKRAAAAESKHDQLSAFVKLDSKTKSSRLRGGNGRGTVIRGQTIQSELGKTISGDFQLYVMTYVTGVYPDGWRNYSDRPNAVCQHVLRLMGYGKPKNRPLPDFCKGNRETFWHSIFGILNTTRQNYTNALQRRIVNLMRCMFQEQNDINNDNDDDDMDAPSKLTLEDLKDNLEELARLYEAGGVEEVLNTDAYDYFIDFIVTFGPKCPPEQLSTTAVKKVDTGHHNVIDTIGQESLMGIELAETTWEGDGLRESGKGGNVGAVGDVALDKEGLKMHNSFIQFMINLQKHDSYEDVNQQIVDR
ncbi:hypothetical protein THAOC_15034 [Thalassiosira oceanica]|uniref:DUF6820 domain-containing protein n=1 Tax=Thalassiosira oceanica TaxID=159749 RepID=K0STD0_THAOC|nr:hypothetical protein THAOC_15034 [Thalassiosira oceanica]|eukprot:EJK64251.1 hypothetical protein THAOC_15034 [Thalassiosira oceanica]